MEIEALNNSYTNYAEYQIVTILRNLGLPVLSLKFDNKKSEHYTIAQGIWELVMETPFHPMKERREGTKRSLYDKDLKNLIRRAFHNQEEDRIRSMELENENSTV